MRAGCRHIFACERDPRATLRALAERAPSNDEVDLYGERALAERLEARVAQLLGKEAAVWMPSGTMAQQIALRIHCERRGNRRIAFHPQCHLDVHEERGYARLHGLHADLLGSRERLPTPEDLEAVREPLGAVVLELPAREIGGQLPAWEQLTVFCTKAHDEGIALHMDGARLWQCTPFYQRTLAEIADLFDTVYVSFYKDLGAPAGAGLTGRKVVIDEARVWQIRHGGRLFTAYPFLLAAERGLDEILPRMPEFVARTNELAAALGALDGVEIVPDPAPDCDVPPPRPPRARTFERGRTRHCRTYEHVHRPLRSDRNSRRADDRADGRSRELPSRH
jgi:threonine aldolase